MKDTSITHQWVIDILSAGGNWKITHMWVIDILSAGDNWKITHMWVIDILSAGGDWKITYMWVIGRRICFTISISYLCFNFTVKAVNITKRVD